MRDAYLVDYARSAFSRAHPYKPQVDAWAGTRGDVLLAGLVDHLLARGQLPADAVEDLSVGCALSVREQWNFGGRYPQWLSTLGHGCATRSIDQQCGSGLAALRGCAREIQAGAIELGLAGGYENMTRVPMGPTLFDEGVLTVPPRIGGAERVALEVALNMGLTAENLAAEAGISRAAMDAFALTSHHRAAAAEADGFLAGERVALSDSEGNAVERDANIRGDTSLDKLAGLKPAFREDGIVTAGNSSPLTSGAAAAVLMSGQAVERYGAQPLARIVGFADCGVQPELMGAGATAAIRRVLAQTGLDAARIDAWEINEAFSVVPLYAMRQLGLDAERVNVRGGALALGHPLGATGVRLAGTLARILGERQGRYGCAAACIGGGQGIAMVIERC